MTEREYIMATELRAVRIAKDIVRPLIDVNQIEREYVMTTLRRWEEKFERLLNVEEEGS